MDYIVIVRNMNSIDPQSLLYKVKKTDNEQFLIVNAADRVVMTCHDLNSANHYVSLLNEAFKAGYKFGYGNARLG